MSDQVNLDPFDEQNVKQVQLIVQMRTYDALMAILANLNEDGAAAAEVLHNLHAQGKIVGSLPVIDLTEED